MLPRLVQLVLVLLGHEAKRQSRTSLSSSRWPCPRSPAVGPTSVEINPNPLPALPKRSRDPDHEDKSMEWIPDCCWPLHGTTDPATSATEDGESPVLEKRC
jgi:hypothetical protein